MLYRINIYVPLCSAHLAYKSYTRQAEDVRTLIGMVTAPVFMMQQLLCRVLGNNVSLQQGRKDITFLLLPVFTSPEIYPLISSHSSILTYINTTIS